MPCPSQWGEIVIGGTKMIFQIRIWSLLVDFFFWWDKYMIFQNQRSWYVEKSGFLKHCSKTSFDSPGVWCPRTPRQLRPNGQRLLLLRPNRRPKLRPKQPQQLHLTSQRQLQRQLQKEQQKQLLQKPDPQRGHATSYACIHGDAVLV